MKPDSWHTTHSTHILNSINNKLPRDTSNKHKLVKGKRNINQHIENTKTHKTTNDIDTHKRYTKQTQMTFYILDIDTHVRDKK
jgi:hypothetical protein